MYLACCVKPYMDELFISYINRLASCNMSTGIHDFIKRYLYPSCIGSGSLLYPTDVLNFTERIRQTTKVFPDASQVVSMTPYRADAGTLPEKEQARFLESMLYNNLRHSVPKLKFKHDTSLRYCPLCAAEDMKNGVSPYLRLFHHLPDVKVCRKHREPLVQIGGCFTDHRKRIFCDIVLDNPDDMPYCVPDMEKAVEHAERMYNISQSPPLFETAFCKHCGKPFIAHPYSIKSGIVCGHCMSNLSDREAITLRLKAIYGNEYILSDGMGDLSRDEVVHVPCGNTLKRSLNTLIYGERKPCAKCAYKTPEKLQSLIPDRFFVLPFKRKGRIWKAEILDTKCGHIFSATLQTFVKDPHCPRCEPRQKVVDLKKEYTDYEILTYKHRNLKFYVIGRSPADPGCSASSSGRLRP